MISRSKVISWLVAIITFGALVGIEFAFRKPLFSRTLTFIHKFQSHTNSISMKVWRQFSDTGVATLPAIILLMTIDYRQRSRQVYYFMMFTIILFVMSITKIAYREARPFWIDPTVYQKDCSSGFGNPSGHSMTASALSFTLALDIASLIKGSLSKVIIVQLVLFLISTVYFLGIGFSRLVLGVHSLNQVVYGWLIGLWIAFFCHFVIREQLKTRVEQFLKKGNVHWKDATAVSVAYVFVIGAQVATFYIVDS